MQYLKKYQYTQCRYIKILMFLHSPATVYRQHLRKEKTRKENEQIQVFSHLQTPFKYYLDFLHVQHDQ